MTIFVSRSAIPGAQMPTRSGCVNPDFGEASVWAGDSPTKPRQGSCGSAKGEGSGPQIKKCGAHASGSARVLVDPGYAASFLTDFPTLLGCLVVGFFSFLDFSLAANSCLTFVVMASVSTL
jgi:hypothetical protein